MKTLFLTFRLPFFLLLFAAYLPTLGAPKLDYTKVKGLYKEGEFEKVRDELETFLKKADSHASREDKITAYKYLGVIYGSKPGGKPQSETYFFRLFDLAPKVNLTELYVSSSVDQIFRDTRERFIAEKQSSGSVDEFGNPKIDDDTQGEQMTMAAQKGKASDSLGIKESKAPIKNEPKSQPKLGQKKMKVWPWVLGAAVVGGGVGVYLMTSQAQPEEHKTLEAGF